VSSSWLCSISVRLADKNGEYQLSIDMDGPVLQVFFAVPIEIKVTVHRTLRIILFTTKGTKVSKKIRGEKPDLHAILVCCFLFVLFAFFVVNTYKNLMRHRIYA